MKRNDSEVVLSITDLCKSFGGILVADNISLELRRGEILGLIGPNGAGKTSLFNLISGVIQSDAGLIKISGTQINGFPLSRRARLGISRTWQHMRLFESMDVIDNMLIAPRIYPGESLLNILLRPIKVKNNDKLLFSQAMSILERMNLKDLAHQRITDISFGQQKLIGLARALMNDGDCLLLDEPMAGVEGQAYETMQNIIHEEAASGKAICIVEHNISFIKDLCNNAIFMSNGKILERGKIDDLLASKTLTELYFGT